MNLDLHQVETNNIVNIKQKLNKKKQYLSF